ncbi:coenzyme F420-reducing hydrogenase gamma subunit [Saccharothrix coeruleofusca]|uniref:NADH-quinone oxidoreductase subunit B family protein n=1 Tax=Saccharothrix coeruleofusca TaxID=33919 RepID=UPI001AE25EEB|nr:oxidoreductase [Saccharothrix coeruleofusca]MBP2336572.1 coenzyme F420-reducing hydrogenase gamma subunit [Saccharothrix coeruleofusca]
MLLDCFPEARARPGPGPHRVSVVVGSVTTAHDVERLTRIRARSEVLVVVGACATADGIRALRGVDGVDGFESIVYASPGLIRSLDTATSVSEHVRVDLELRGCPVDRERLRSVLSALLAGHEPDPLDERVCVDCKLRGLTCTAATDGVPCLGPVTHVGCGALCPTRRCGCSDPLSPPALIPLPERS